MIHEPVEATQTAVAELFGDKIAIEMVGNFLLVGFDATNEVRSSNTHFTHELGQRGLKLGTHSTGLFLGLRLLDLRNGLIQRRRFSEN